MLLKIITTTILCCSFIFVSAQDLHFSNYEYSPLYLSPAKTGAYAGTYRIGGSGRQQFNSFIEKPYQTLMLYADSPIAFGFSKKHWIGIGMTLFDDRAGDLARQYSGILASAAYHMGLDDKFNNVITLGFQYGRTQFRINRDLARWVDVDEGDLLDNFKPSLSDVNVGLSFKSRTSKKAFFEIGAAVYHITQADYSFANSSVRNPVGRRMNFYGEYHIQSSDRLYIRPTFVYSSMYNFKNMFGQINLEYAPNKKSDTKVTGGLGYRVGDAIQLMAGVIFKGWHVGLAYDLTVSSAATYNNSFGGIELGAYKIFTVNKKPKVDPKALCPRL